MATSCPWKGSKSRSFGLRSSRTFTTKIDLGRLDLPSPPEPAGVGLGRLELVRAADRAPAPGEGRLHHRRPGDRLRGELHGNRRGLSPGRDRGRAPGGGRLEKAIEVVIRQESSCYYDIFSGESHLQSYRMIFPGRSSPWVSALRAASPFWACSPACRPSRPNRPTWSVTSTRPTRPSSAGTGKTRWRPPEARPSSSGTTASTARSSG